jgi:cell wall-associated NlpC family hydrolase
VPVSVPGQPSSLERDGYPGWVAVSDLTSDVGYAALVVARGFLGTPYRWGGLSGAGVDCSGLVHLAFRATGTRMPRDAHDQHTVVPQVPLGEARQGDLWFFAKPGARVHHVGFNAGDGRILHAPEPGREVVVEPLPPERMATLVGVGRVPGAVERNRAAALLGA